MDLCEKEIKRLPFRRDMMRHICVFCLVVSLLFASGCVAKESTLSVSDVTTTHTTTETTSAGVTASHRTTETTSAGVTTFGVTCSGYKVTKSRDFGNVNQYRKALGAVHTEEDATNLLGKHKPAHTPEKVKQEHMPMLLRDKFFLVPQGCKVTNIHFVATGYSHFYATLEDGCEITIMVHHQQREITPLSYPGASRNNLTTKDGHTVSHYRIQQVNRKTYTSYWCNDYLLYVDGYPVEISQDEPCECATEWMSSFSLEKVVIQ